MSDAHRVEKTPLTPALSPEYRGEGVNPGANPAQPPSPPRTIINVANRLPVTIGETEFKKSSGGLVAALEGVSPERFSLRWIGWPGSAVAAERQPDVRRKLQSDYQASPVFLTEQQAEGFYEGFANASLWPLLHYMPSRFRYKAEWWDDYEAVNRQFAEQVLDSAKDGDLVWVHDYQLMLLPAMLKEARPGLRVGFFLHTPFPSYEIFRCHPRRGELLNGMLGADQVGFHTFGYLRHFRSSVLRLLGVESELTHIRHAGHTAYLGVYPIGINAAKFDRELTMPAFAERLAELSALHKADGRRVIVSVERLDYTKGILQRLDAIDLFLRDCPGADRDALGFIFVSVPSRENVKEYRRLREDVEARVGRINGHYATLRNSPIHFIHGSVDFTDLCALYALADACMVTPLVDGMNLVAKEYVACQRDDAPGNGGALILSEFAGAAEELFNALIVNPYDAGSVAAAVGQALTMPAEEKRQRMRPMRERVMKFDAGWWARTFIDDLAVREPAPSAGADIREAGSRLSDALAAGKRVALFLDYDGTLREIEREPSAAKPNAAVRPTLDLLRDAATDGRVRLEVTIISGRRAEELEAWLGDYPFGLIAEHGAALRRPGQGDGRQWEQLDRNVDYSWKPELLKLLKVYADSTPGSFVEEKRTSLVWHYRKADPEFGTWKANELAEELAVVTANDPVQVRRGRKIVEVAAAQVSKGAAVARAMDEDHSDVALAAGDDLTDESMFRLDVRSTATADLLTVKVGPGDTAARYRLATPAEFRRFLERAVRLPADFRPDSGENPARHAPHRSAPHPLP